MSGRNYREDGSRIWECDTCDCTHCEHRKNDSYDSKECRFRLQTCAVCKGRHCMVMCPNYNEVKTKIWR